MGLRVAIALYYLTGMVGLRHAEAGLHGPPHVARMVLFVRDDGPPPRGGWPPRGFRGPPRVARMVFFVRDDGLPPRGGRPPGGWFRLRACRAPEGGLELGFEWWFACCT